MWTVFVPRVDRFLWRRPLKPAQQQPLIFLVILAFWTGLTGRTGFAGEESPTKFYDRAARGVDDPSEQQR